MCSLVILSKYCSTKSKTLLAESFGQRLLVIFTALLPFYVEQPHDKGSALYKYPTNCCKNNLERSTDPRIFFHGEFNVMKKSLYLVVNSKCGTNKLGSSESKKGSIFRYNKLNALCDFFRFYTNDLWP